MSLGAFRGGGSRSGGASAAPKRHEGTLNGTLPSRAWFSQEHRMNWMEECNEKK